MLEKETRFLYQGAFCRYLPGSEKYVSDVYIREEITRAFSEFRCFPFFLNKNLLGKFNDSAALEDVKWELSIEKDTLIGQTAGDNVSLRNRLLRNASFSALISSSLEMLYSAIAASGQTALASRRFVFIREEPGKPAFFYRGGEGIVIAHVGQGPEWREIPTIYLSLGIFNSLVLLKQRNDGSGPVILRELLSIEERAIETGYSHIEEMSAKQRQIFGTFIEGMIETGSLPVSVIEDIHLKWRPRPFTSRERERIAVLLDARRTGDELNFNFQHNLAGIKELEKLARRYKRAGDENSLKEVVRLLVASSGHDLHEIRNRASILLERIFSSKEFDAPPATFFVTVRANDIHKFRFSLGNRGDSYLLRIYFGRSKEDSLSITTLRFEDIPLVHNKKSGYFEAQKTFTRLGQYDFLIFRKKQKNYEWMQNEGCSGRINVIPDIRGEIVLEIFTDIHGHTKLYWNDPDGRTGLVYNEYGEVIRLGCFSDITAHLEDIKERYLVTALYLLGVQKRGTNREDWAPEARSASPFSPVSLVDIEPSLGGEEELSALVKEAHKLGIHIIVDIVPHINRRSNVLSDDLIVKCYDDAGNLVVRASTDGRYGSWNDGKLLNYRKFEVWEWMADSVLALIDRFDIDGIRVDSAQSIPVMMKRNNLPWIYGKKRGHISMLEGEIVVNDREDGHYVTTGYYDSSCSDLIANPFQSYLMGKIEGRLQERNKKFFVYLAECYWGRERHLSRTGIIPYNSALFKICEHIIQGKTDVREIYHLYNNYYPKALADGTELLGILGNHDERRALNSFGLRGLRAAIGLISFMSSIIMDYEGGAEGEGWKVFLDNIYVNWNQFDAAANRGLYLFYKDVYDFHRNQKGKGYLVWADNNMVAAVLKKTADTIWLGAFNFSDNNQFARLRFDDPKLPLKDDARYRLVDPTYSLITGQYNHFTGKELKVSKIDIIVPYTERIKLLRLEEETGKGDSYHDFLRDSFLRAKDISNPEHFPVHFVFRELCASLTEYESFTGFLKEKLLPSLNGSNGPSKGIGLKRLLYHAFREKSSRGTIILEYIDSLRREKDEVLNTLGEELSGHFKYGSIVFIAGEAEPFSKSGGLANVVYELPKQLSNMEETVIVITPFYQQGGDKAVLKIKEASRKYGIKYTGKNVQFNILGAEYSVGVHHGIVEGVEYYLLDHYEFFDGLYFGYTGNEKFRRRVAFARACAEVICTFGLNPSFVLSNEAFSGLFNAVVRTDHVYAGNSNFLSTKFFFVIHNGGWQYSDSYHRYENGFDLFNLCNLPGHLADQFLDPREPTKINCMAAGIRFSDYVITVSPSYARQIESQCDGLEDLLHNVIGISNAIDKNFASEVKKHIRSSGFVRKDVPLLTKTIMENPLLLGKIKKRYPEILEGESAIRGIKEKVRKEMLLRLRNKMLLQRAYGLDIDPDAILFSMIHRITEQKGFQLLLEASSGIFTNLGFQGIIGGQVASGDIRGEEIVRGLLRLQNYFPGRVSVTPGFMDVRAPIFASDVFLMPSLSEPGGISQLEAMVCGDLVVARATGGLRDTVSPLHIRNKKVNGNGFLFSDYNSAAFYDGMERCANFFHTATDEQIYRARQNAVKGVRFWNDPAREYRRKLYDLKEIIRV